MKKSFGLLCLCMMFAVTPVMAGLEQPVQAKVITKVFHSYAPGQMNKEKFVNYLAEEGLTGHGVLSACIKSTPAYVACQECSAFVNQVIEEHNAELRRAAEQVAEQSAKQSAEQAEQTPGAAEQSGKKTDAGTGTKTDKKPAATGNKKPVKKQCAFGGKNYADGTKTVVETAKIPSAKSHLDNSLTADCLCNDGQWSCVAKTCKDDRYTIKDNKCVFKPQLRDIYEEEVFKKTQVNKTQGINLIKLWAKQTGLGAISCENTFTKESNDYTIICTTDSARYHILFDDLEEGNKGTAYKSIAYKVCELLGGQKVTESDTGLSSMIRCDLPDGRKCEDLNPALAPFSGIKAVVKEVRSTPSGGNGYSSKFIRSYCAIDY